jgi:hypothetical protein
MHAAELAATERHHRIYNSRPRYSYCSESRISAAPSLVSIQGATHQFPMAVPRHRSVHPIVLQGLHTILFLDPDSIDGSHSFIALGGDSLTAVRLAAYCKERQLPVLVREIIHSKRVDEIAQPEWDDALQQSPPDELSVPYPEAIVSNERGSLKDLGLDSLTPPRTESNTSDEDDEDVLEEAAFTETQLSFIHQTENTPGTNIIRFCETYSYSSLPDVRRAWKAVIHQEAIFHPRGPRNESKASHPPWTETTVNSKQDYREGIARAKLTETKLSCFVVINLLTPDVRDSVSTVVWCVHHAFIDGYSANLLHRKMLRMANGHATTPGPSFWTIASTLKQLQLARQESTTKYWVSKCATFASAAWAIEFPCAHAPLKPQPEEPIVTLNFAPERISDRCTVNNITPAAYYCSAWGLALSKLLDNDQVSFGMVFSGRDLPVTGIEETIGPFINTLPFFVTTAQAATMDNSTYVRRVFETLCEYSDYQLPRREDLDSRRYSSVIAFQYDMGSNSCDPSDTIQPTGHSSFTMDSDVSINVVIQDRGVVQIRFDSEQYSMENMRILADLFRNAMDVLLSPTSSLMTCLDRLISSKVRADILHASNCDTVSTFNHSANSDDDIVTLFETAVNKHPRSCAIVKGSRTITYKDFDSAVASVSQRLSHIQPGEPVCVIADRSINWLIAVFGVLRVRGVYVPLDPGVPPIVRHDNAERCGARAVLASTDSDISICPSNIPEQYIVEHILQESHVPVPQSRRSSPFPEDGAYICFTSGSTGKPKAVQCTHKGLVAFIGSKEIRLHAEHGVRIAQTMSPVFDGSILEIFSALCYGATLVLQDDNADHPFDHVKECDVALFTPSVGKVLNVRDYPKLKHVSLSLFLSIVELTR